MSTDFIFHVHCIRWVWCLHCLISLLGPWAARPQAAQTLKMHIYWMGSKSIWDAHFCTFLHLYLINENLRCMFLMNQYTLLNRIDRNTILSYTGFFFFLKHASQGPSAILFHTDWFKQCLIMSDVSQSEEMKPTLGCSQKYSRLR